MQKRDTRAMPEAREQARSPSLTIAICSNRARPLERAALTVASTLAAGDELIVVWDDEPVLLSARARRQLASLGVVVHDNRRNCGLSASRNVALARCSTPFLVFVDDDVSVTAATMEGLRRAFAEGSGVVGCRIVADLPAALPWWISEGQIHLLAVHPKSGEANIWGACFGFDVRLARDRCLSFDPRLGRRGTGLQSGDDTTFVASLVQAGALRTFLSDHEVLHDIPPDRLRFRYVARRSFWQGRSEFRRASVRRGLRKEAHRAVNPDVPWGRRISLGSLYMALIVAGVGYEAGLAPARYFSRRGHGPHYGR